MNIFRRCVRLYSCISSMKIKIYPNKSKKEYYSNKKTIQSCIINNKTIYISLFIYLVTIIYFRYNLTILRNYFFNIIKKKLNKYMSNIYIDILRNVFNTLYLYIME